MPYLLTPEDSVGTTVSGFVSVNGAEYTIRISGIATDSGGGTPAPSVPAARLPLFHTGPAAKPFAAASLECCPRLARLFRDPRVLASRLRLASSMENFVAELVDLVQSMQQQQSSSGSGGSLAAQDIPAAVPDTRFYQRLISEIDALGWGHLVDLNDMMTRLALRYTDSRGRPHVVGFEIPREYPRRGPVVRHALPVPFAPPWNSRQGDTLATLVGQFRAELERLAVFWDDLDEVDAQCWVQEPENATRAHRHRRVVIAKHCSVTVEVPDPYHPRKLPLHRFLGAASVVSAHQEKFNARVRAWDPGRSLLQNLEAELGLKLPSRATTQATDYILNCGICYSYRLDPQGGGGGGGGGHATGDGNDGGGGGGGLGPVAFGRKPGTGATPVADHGGEPHLQKRPRLGAHGEAAQPAVAAAAARKSLAPAGSAAGARDVDASLKAAAAALFDGASRTELGGGRGGGSASSSGGGRGNAAATAVSTPDQICENDKCGKSFHHECLLEWMRSTPASRQSFNTLFGNCPYCSSPISIDTLKRGS